MPSCSSCKAVKPVTEFYRARDKSSGHMSQCKQCISKYFQSNAGKAARKRASKRYHSTPKGREVHRDAHRRYRETLKYKAAFARYRAENTEKRKAQIGVMNALARGDLVRPSICSLCHDPCTPHGHHPDYTKPLDVVWLCHNCHVLTHQVITLLCQKRQQLGAPQ